MVSRLALTGKRRRSSGRVTGWWSRARARVALSRPALQRISALGVRGERRTPIGATGISHRMNKLPAAAIALSLLGTITASPAFAEDPCNPTAQPDGVLVAVGPECDPEWYPGAPYYVQGEAYTDPQPTLADSFAAGPVSNPRGCKSAVVLRMEVSSNIGVPMTADGSVYCEGQNIWGLRGTLDIRQANNTVRASRNWNTGYHGLPPMGSSATYDSTSSGHTVRFNCQDTVYRGYRASSRTGCSADPRIPLDRVRTTP